MTQVGVMTKTHNEVAAGPARRHKLLAQLWPGSALKGSIPALDGLRGVAVLVVMLFHAYHPTDGKIIYTSPLDALSYGRTGVQLFFVLSGFLLFLPYASWLFGLKSKPSLWRFYERRLLRVGPAYWVNIAFIVTLAHFSMRAVMAALAYFPFLQNLFVGPTSRLNGVLWTMAVEVQFYLLLPLLAWFMFQLARVLPRALSIGLVLGAGEAISILCAILSRQKAWNAIPYFTSGLITNSGAPYWLGVFGVGMGCSVLYVYVTQVRHLAPETMRRVRLLATCAFFIGLGLALGVALTPSLQLNWPFMELAYGWFYAAILIGSLLGSALLRWPFERNALRFFGHISYSLYLWHLYLLNRIEPRLTMIHDHGLHTLIGFLLDAAVAIPVAYVAFQLTERPFFSLRQRAREGTASARASAPAPFADVRHETSAHVVNGAGAPSFASTLAPRPTPESTLSGGWTSTNRSRAVQPGHVPGNVGHVIGGYRLEQELGESSHGMSFYAQRLTAELVTWGAAMTSNTVVLKTLWPPSGSVADLRHPEFQRRFARLTVDLQAVCGVLIPTAVDAGAAQFISWSGDPQQPYLVRTFIPGYSLAERVGFERRGLPLAEVASYIARIGAALDYAHARHITHGACTLENVLITQHGVLTVTDFGLEQLLAPLPGRPSAPPRRELARYLAPERLKDVGQVTTIGDIYSMGVILHVLLTGAFPFDGVTAEDIRVVRQSRQRTPLSAYRTDVTAEIESVIMRALAPLPQNRFTSAGALASAFTAAVERATGEKLYIEPPHQSLRSQPPSQSLPSQQAAPGGHSSSPFSSPDPQKNGAGAASGGSGTAWRSRLPSDSQEEATLLDPTLPRIPRTAAPATDKAVNRERP